MSLTPRHLTLTLSYHQKPQRVSAGASPSCGTFSTFL
jgi:hypothetical protein